MDKYALQDLARDIRLEIEKNRRRTNASISDLIRVICSTQILLGIFFLLCLLLVR